MKFKMKLSMKSLKHISLLLIINCFIVTAFAQQSVEFKKSNFPGKTAEFKIALKELKTGNKMYEQEFPDYQMALSYFQKAQNFNPENAELNYKIGVCYTNSSNKGKAIPYLEKAQKLDNTIASDLWYQLGVAYHANYKFDMAIDAFQKFRGQLTPDDMKYSGSILTRKIEECNNAKEFMKDTVRAFVDNMGEVINSSCSDYSPLITADQSMLVITSKRANPYNKKLDKSTGEYDENIWYSYRTGSTWSPLTDIGKPLNTSKNDATVGISPDGQKMFTYYEKNGGDILYTEKKGDTWKSPDSFDDINSEWHEAAASFSFDGKTVYFSSTNRDKVINYGDHDIFKCVMNEKGKWGKPINLGATINSHYDEVDVFMHPDGRTMYFSSDGHKSMGGYDVFKSELQDDGSWSEPVNVGYPINTPGDERFFVLAGSGRNGYYSSSKDGGFGRHDVYVITFLGPEKKVSMATENNLIAAFANPIKQEVVIEKSVEIKTSRLTIVKGTVSDAFAQQLTYLEAQIEITDNETGKLISTLNSNAATGKFLIPLPSGKDYGIAVKKEGYLFYSENFNIPATSQYQEKVLDIKLMQLKKDAKIVLRNVFFEFGSAKLDPKSYTELDNLIKILTDNPNMIIEIGGHTDNVGSYTFNQKLSESRAQSVVNYLSKAIPMNRLQYKGYAFDVPVAENTTEAGRALNRRVEFKIISN